MKKSTAILSHLCIFALGIAVAVVSKKRSDEETQAALVSRDAGSTGGTGLNSRAGSENRSVAAREMREGADRVTGSKPSPRESLRKINGITDTYERQRNLMDFLDGLSPESFADVADEFQQLDHYGNTGTETELLFQAWAKVDPLAALDYMDSNPGMSRNRGEVLEIWAVSDPAAAEKWALDKHEGDGANPYLASVIKGIASYDLDKAYQMTMSMPMGRERGPAIDAVAKALLMKGTEAAFAFPETIQDEHLKGSFVMIISQNLARRDPQAAADWVASLESGAVQDRASGEVAGRLARVDVDKAAEFVSSLQPAAKANAAAATVPAMSQNDIAGTARWVSSMAGTPGYDKIVESFVWSCDSRAPEQSAAWISGVSDPVQQTKLYHRMLGEWQKKDANAVRTWVAENEVPSSVRKRFSR
jgi:hypothetical protein